jgi:hypothetical protein
MYPEIVKAVEAALSLETTKYGDCTKLQQARPGHVPDLAKPRTTRPRAKTTNVSR